MAQVGQDGETGAGNADLHLILLAQQIQVMERPARAKQALWPGLVVLAAALATLGR